jgi:hypothetical protein
MHRAGIAKVDDLVKEAMLDPELATALLSKVPREQAESRLMKRLQKVVSLNAASEAQRAVMADLLLNPQPVAPKRPDTAALAGALMAGGTASPRQTVNPAALAQALSP